MGFSYRVGSAALLILAFFFIRRHLDELHYDPTDIWQNGLSDNYDNPAYSHSYNYGEQEPDSDLPPVAPPVYETTPIIVPSDRVIVMAKLAHEDTSWVSNELAHWRNVIYTVDDQSATRHTPLNKGRESLAYLLYIIEHYHNLPSTMAFLHSHRDGWPEAWHVDTMDFSNVDSIRALQEGFIQTAGYASLRCQETPGCPEEIHPDPASADDTDRVFAEAWEALFNNTDVPAAVGAPCCSQFAVSRDQVLKRPLSDYERFYEWVVTNDLPDEMTSHVMEFMWHIIFGKEPVFCPDAFQCYEDVYGDRYFWK